MSVDEGSDLTLPPQTRKIVKHLIRGSEALAALDALREEDEKIDEGAIEYMMQQSPFYQKRTSLMPTKADCDRQIQRRERNTHYTELK